MLKAKVQNVTGNTQHFVGIVKDGKLVGGKKIGDPDYVQIEEGSNGYYLFRFNDDANGVCSSDSWFETLDQAKKQAKFEFEIEPDHWETIEE